MHQPANYVSEEEYLRLAEASVTKLEYYDGIIVDRAAQFEGMAGGSREHSKITNRAAMQLTTAFDALKKGCEGYTSDYAIYIDEIKSYCYPDFSIICGEPNTPKENQNSATNPLLILEVLSYSTAEYDLGPKVNIYKKLKSIRCILLMSQTHAFVHCHTRHGEEWTYTTYSEPGSMIDLGSLEIMVSIEDLYGNPNDLLYVSRRSGA